MPDNLENSKRGKWSPRRTRVIVLSVATILLLASLVILQAFNTEIWFTPDSASSTLILFGISTLNVIAFIVLLMVLVRTILKLRRENQRNELGSRFATRLVLFSVALSLLPVIFMFSSTVLIINRSVDKWFSLPARRMAANAREIQSSFLANEQDELRRIAVTLARVAVTEKDPTVALRSEVINQKLSSIEVYDQAGKVQSRQTSSDSEDDFLNESIKPVIERALQGTEATSNVMHVPDRVFLIAAVPLPSATRGIILVTQRIEPNLAKVLIEVTEENRSYETTYDSLHRNRRGVRDNALLVLGLLTLFALFISTWMAVKVSRTIAEPVRQLALATRRIKEGDLSVRTDIVGDDELAQLARSFNEMATEMQFSRGQLEQSAVALDERRRYIETVLQNLSAGVISLDDHGHITTINPAAIRLLRLPSGSEPIPEDGAELVSLLPEEQRDELRRMIRRALRGRTVSREVHFKLANEAKLDAAITVTALPDSRGHSHGTVIVIEDMSNLIEAQRRAAWSEVARRMAHEIKNPLTPIRLSAERLAKNLLGNGASPADSGESASNGTRLDERGRKLVRECTTLIGAEVETLQRMVDEFSSFARLPAARPVMSDISKLVSDAIKLYEERLDGIHMECHLGSELPPVMADPDQIKRLLVNLIDNAIHAITENYSPDGIKQVVISTSEIAERDALEISVSDTGPGIPATDRELIFSPYFSTRKRGTGLGLAIVSHIVAEHGGKIRVEDNLPHGARFVIELPSAKE